LAKGLFEIENIHIDMKTVQTNMVFADINADMSNLCNFLKQKGVVIGTSSHLRLVTHLDISKEDIDYTIQAFKDFFTTSY
jgi:threonine aldolase